MPFTLHVPSWTKGYQKVLKITALMEETVAKNLDMACNFFKESDEQFIINT